MKTKKPTLKSLGAPYPRSWVEYADGRDLPTEVGRLRRQVRILAASALGFLGMMGTGFGFLTESGEYSSTIAGCTIAMGFLGVVLLGGNARGTSDYADILESPRDSSELDLRRQALGLPLVIHHRVPGLPLRDERTGGLASDIPSEDGDAKVSLPSFAYIGVAIPIADASLYKLDHESELRSLTGQAGWSRLG